MAEVGGAVAIATASSTATAVAQAIATSIATAVAGISIAFGYVVGSTLKGFGEFLKGIGEKIMELVKDAVNMMMRLVMEKPEIGVTGLILAIYLLAG
jgi:hypothetical protein